MRKNIITFPKMPVSNNTLRDWASDLRFALKGPDPMLRECVTYLLHALENRNDDKERVSG